MSMLTLRPVISSLVYPKRRAAAGLTHSITPSSRMVMIPSMADSKTALSCRAASEYDCGCEVFAKMDCLLVIFLVINLVKKSGRRVGSRSFP